MRRTWSRDDIILALWEWAEEHGKQPRSSDWVVSGGDKHPSFTTVYKHFGSWDEAIRKAGFIPFKQPRVEFDERLAKKLRREGVTDVEIGKRLGISADVLNSRLGPRPKPVTPRKKRTREQRIADLRKALEEEEHAALA